MANEPGGSPPLLQTPNPKTLRFRVGMSDAYASGELVRGPRWKAAANFPARDVTIDELAAHVMHGGAIAAGTYAPGDVITPDNKHLPVDAHRSKADFIGGQLMLLDFDDDAQVDVARALAHPFIGRYAAIVHTSKSGTGVHVIFVLDRTITDGPEHELLTVVLMRAVADLHPDPACKDCSRMFYGSTQPGGEVRYQLLPVAVLEDLAAELRAEQQRIEADRLAAAARRIPATGDRLNKAGERFYEARLQVVASAGSGSRNSTLYGQARKLFQRMHGGWPGYDQARITADLLAIAAGWGAEELHKAESTIASAERKARSEPDYPSLDPAPRKASRSQKRPTPEPEYEPKIGATALATSDREPPGFDVLGPLDAPPDDEGSGWMDELPAPTPADEDYADRLLQRLTHFPADQRIDRPFVNVADFYTPTGLSGLILRSDVSTGKTAAAIEEARRMIAQGGRVLFLTHRRALARDFTNRAIRAGLEITHYQDVTSTAQLRQVPGSLAACIDTFVMLADGKPLPLFNLLIIDEFDQLLAHIYDGGTLKERAPLAGEVLRRLIGNSGRVLAFDAHASSTAVDYIREIKDDVIVADNTHRADRGAMTLYEHRTALLAELPRLLEANAGPVAVMCASEREAEQLAAQAAELLGGAHVLCLTADNAGGERQRAFLANPDRETPRYRVIFASPVLGTGFDIQAPVAAVVLLDQGAHLTAWDLRQMIGRFRRAGAVYAYVRRGSPELDPALFDPQTLAQAYTDTDEYSATLLASGTLDADGRNLPPARLQEYTRWHARLLATRNASKALVREHFIRLADGYAITLNTDQHNREAAAEQAQRRKERDALLRALALTVAPVNDKTWARLKEAGTITDEHRAGYTRWAIEDLTGEGITEPRRDLLWSRKARAAVLALCDQFDTFEALQNEDRAEALADTPYHQRAYRTLRRVLGRRFIGQFLDLDTGAVLPGKTADEIRALAAELHNEPNTITALRRFCGRRLPTTAAGLIRAALRVFGLTLKTTRTGEAHVSTYALDAVETATALELARLALRQRLIKRAQEEDRACQKLRTPRSEGECVKVGSPSTPAGNARTGAGRTPDRRPAMGERFPYFEAAGLMSA